MSFRQEHVLQPEVHGGPSSTYPVRMLLPHLTLVLDLAGKEPRQAIFRAQTLTHLNRTVTTGGVSSLEGWVTRLGQKGTRKEPNLISPRGSRRLGITHSGLVGQVWLP